MNELEPKGVPQEEAIQPENTNTAAPKEADTPQNVNPTEPEAKEEAPEAAPVEEAAPETSERVNYHTLTKPELVAALQAIIEEGNMTANREVASIKAAFQSIRNAEADAELAKFVDAGNDPAAFVLTPDADEARFKELLNDFKEKRAEYLAAEEKRRQENLEKKQGILDRMREIATDIDKVNVNFKEFQELQNGFKEVKDIPQQAESDIWKNYQMVVEQFYDHLKMNKELRDLDFKRNLDAKKQLINDAQALAADLETDIVELFRKLQDLHLRWREIGPVAKELREEIWEEFKAASTIINKRHQEFFEGRKAQENENEKAKTALCEEIEAINLDEINTFNAWDAATEKVKDLQARWKQLGYASRKANTALYNRFRESCDKFFAGKAEYFKRTKEEFATNLAKKEALVAEAEGLRATDDTRKAIDRIVQLQAEWKKIGAVARKHSDAVWQRFQAACNYFFEERRKLNAETRQSENANLAAKREVIEKLKTLPTDGERNEVIPQVRELQTRWNEIGHVPFRMKDKIYGEYRTLVNALYEAYNMKENARRMNRFENRVKELRNDGNGITRERDRLVRALENKQNELKTFENNLGFFNVKSSAGSSMVADMERRINRVKDEIAEIEKKIKLIDNPAPAEEAPEAPAPEAPESAAPEAPAPETEAPEAAAPEAEKAE